MIAYHVSDAAAVASALRALGAPTKAASALAAAYPGARGLSTATALQIASAAGVPESRAWVRRVPAAFSLANVAANQARDDGAPLKTPSAAATRIRRMIGAEPVECFAVLLLDARQHVIDVVIVHRGTLAQVDVHPRDVLRPAVQCGAYCIIVAHNHPSGSAEPSTADLDLTRRLVDAGRLVGIPVVDHIVVTPDSHVSMAASGML